MVVERVENWRIDKSNGFATFGLSERLRARAEEAQVGDKVIVYVSSGISAFADVRRVTEDGVDRLRFGGNYDTAFPICLKTEPYLTLEVSRWVPIKGLVEALSFTRDKRDWRQVMRNSFRQLSQGDAKIIIEHMEASKSEPAKSI